MGTSSVSGKRHHPVFARRARLGAGLAACLLAPGLLLGGCASYANVPEPEAPAAVTSPNHRNPKAVMTASLLRVLRMDPPGSPRFGVALPAGVTEETVTEVLSALGPGAELATSANADLPTYSIGRIWIRSGSAKVDVFRPVVELGRRGDGTFDRQAITVWLEGGLDPWRVIRTQRWEVGAFPRPYAEAQPGESAELDVPESIENGAEPAMPELEATPEEAQDAGPQAAPAPEPAAAPVRREPEPTGNGAIRIETLDPGA